MVIMNMVAPIQPVLMLNVSVIPVNPGPVHPVAKKPRKFGFKNKMRCCPPHLGNTSLLPCPLNFGTFFGITAHYSIASEKLLRTASKTSLIKKVSFLAYFSLSIHSGAVSNAMSIFTYQRLVAELQKMRLNGKIFFSIKPL